MCPTARQQPQDRSAETEKLSHIWFGGEQVQHSEALVIHCNNDFVDARYEHSGGAYPRSIAVFNYLLWSFTNFYDWPFQNGTVVRASIGVIPALRTLVLGNLTHFRGVP